MKTDRLETEEVVVGSWTKYFHLLLSVLLQDYPEESVHAALVLEYVSVHFRLCQPIPYLDLKIQLF